MRHRYPAWCAVCIRRKPGVEILTGFTLEGPCRKCGHDTELAIVKLPLEERKEDREYQHRV